MRPFNSNAPNLSEAASFDSRKLRRVDISVRNVSVAGEEMLNMSRNRGTPSVGYEASEKMCEYACGARCKNVEMRDDSDDTDRRESSVNEDFKLGGNTSRRKSTTVVKHRAIEAYLALPLHLW